jgi:hypothetical protein
MRSLTSTVHPLPIQTSPRPHKFDVLKRLAHPGASTSNDHGSSVAAQHCIVAEPWASRKPSISVEVKTSEVGSTNNNKK